MFGLRQCVFVECRQVKNHENKKGADTQSEYPSEVFPAPHALCYLLVCYCVELMKPQVNSPISTFFFFFHKILTGLISTFFFFHALLPLESIPWLLNPDVQEIKNEFLPSPGESWIRQRAKHKETKKLRERKKKKEKSINEKKIDYLWKGCNATWCLGHGGARHRLHLQM